MNPNMDNARKIGAPQSPMGNRGAYKAPSMMKRANDNVAVNGYAPPGMRQPLGDISGQGNVSTADGGGDVKRQRLDGL